uniref:Uncharacterized protein n=1 Tax=Glossina brevipalpis TaxID=37001 RepID=A0A1A9WWI3_9MUSC
MSLCQIPLCVYMRPLCCYPCVSACVRVKLVSVTAEYNFHILFLTFFISSFFMEANILIVSSQSLLMALFLLTSIEQKSFGIKKYMGFKGDTFKWRKSKKDSGRLFSLKTFFSVGKEELQNSTTSSKSKSRKSKQGRALLRHKIIFRSSNISKTNGDV